MAGYDVVVLGAGHAGCEAALACARMGLNTAAITLNLDSIAMMACNPAIGGTSKGQLVREIDALGGEMGLAADDEFIQMRMLNTGKGPAVYSPRAQMDKRRYHERMKRALEAERKLTLIQGECAEIETEHGRISAIRLSGGVKSEGERIECRAVVVATGVYLKSRILIGDCVWEQGPSGLARAEGLSASLRELGFELRRFKTGTPPRVLGRTLDFDEMEIQNGDSPARPFSFLHDMDYRVQRPCYLTYTNAATHRVILDNINRSAMYSGLIHATGTRYCPSIEDKLVRFADKDRHQLFIEPEGLSTDEMYVQGMSTSLPADVQRDMLRTIPGMRDCHITRYGYAIEYDCIDPNTLDTTLGSKDIPGLYFAGQINGSSGYEEAAAQGLIAGINAARKLQGRESLVLDRSEAYIGVLIDDLVTKESHEPYRMMTSRAEYRLLLRQDNADQRLTEKGYEVGLISQERYDRLKEKERLIESEIERLKNAYVGTSEKIQELLESYESTPLNSGSSLAELIRRPELSYEAVADIDVTRPKLPEDLAEEVIGQVDISLKYDGYIQRQKRQVEQFKKMENKKIPEDMDYDAVNSLRIEAVQKLKEYRPVSIGQASRISGVSPADISVLLVYLSGNHR